jgi:hypothetical protein
MGSPPQNPNSEQQSPKTEPLHEDWLPTPHVPSMDGGRDDGVGEADGDAELLELMIEDGVGEGDGDAELLELMIGDG